jgi:hypothetical protein
MNKTQALSEDLRLMIHLSAEALPGVQSAQPVL